MGEEQLRFGVDDVPRLVIECGHCHTEMAFSGLGEETPPSIVCPSCHQALKDIGPLANTFRQLIGLMRSARVPVSFAARVEKMPGD